MQLEKRGEGFVYLPRKNREQSEGLELASSVGLLHFSLYCLVHLDPLQEESSFLQQRLLWI